MGGKGSEEGVEGRCFLPVHCPSPGHFLCLGKGLLNSIPLESSPFKCGFNVDFIVNSESLLKTWMEIISNRICLSRAVVEVWGRRVLQNHWEGTRVASTEQKHMEGIRQSSLLALPFRLPLQTRLLCLGSPLLFLLQMSFGWGSAIVLP